MHKQRIMTVILSFPGVSFPEGGMGVSRGFDISHSLSRHSLAVTVYHVTIQTPNIIVVQFRSGTVTIQAVWILILMHNIVFFKLR